MAFSETNRVDVRYIAESTFDTLPATPTMQSIKLTGADFAAAKNTTVSETIRADRMRDDVIELSASAAGTLNFELALEAYDEFIEAALCGTWGTQVATAGTDIAASNTNSNLTSTTTDFTAEGLSVGQWIKVAGFTANAGENNGFYRITSITANALGVVPAPTSDEAAGDAVTFDGTMLRNGTVARSFSIEQAFLDVNQFQLFTGMRVGSMALELSSGSIVTGNFGFMGSTASIAGSTNANSVTASNTNSVVNATSNVGTIYENDTLLSTGVQSISLSLDNALREQPVVGSKFVAGIGYGSQSVSGSLTVYFENSNLYTKFLNHTYTSLSFPVTDAAGNTNIITLPRIMFQESAPAPSGIDQDVVETLAFTAVADPATSCQIQVDRFT